ncbi:aminopeptidase [Parendozoicomonas haliclonae]|uniref:Thermophilic metalloprotease (M29) n=1 Tax=Parendozoicomonas haliclonae TaxID=1960125 RepID=A0A1X7ARY8_9GAMM|nr:hypothetical protein [Parendozoicomonas haliclonae]SMA50913.1 Thermophilic metalloprotease (M29) [Parendozoicomonas haliclonae]
MKFTHELQKAADTLVKEIMGAKPGESVVITCDTGSDMDVIDATARAAYSCGAKPVIIQTTMTKGNGKAADEELPLEPLIGALSAADIWIEMNTSWLFYSTAYEKSTLANKNMRYINLVETPADAMIRMVGGFDVQKLTPFMKEIAHLTNSGKEVRITTPNGTNVSFNIEPRHLMCCDSGDATVPGIHMMPGQINFVPNWETINGTITFDGTLTPPLGALEAPIHLTVEKGVIKQVTGTSKQASEFRDWLGSFDDPNMFRMAHVCYGLNPGAKLCGNIVEDERVWGCTEWGIGYVHPLDAPPHGIDAKSHCDGICLNSSVWVDGVQVLDTGKVVHPKLKEMLN